MSAWLALGAIGLLAAASRRSGSRSARSRRSTYSSDRGWGTEPARLQQGHQRRPQVRQAAQRVRRVSLATAQTLGAGNFGTVYALDDGTIVKVANATDIHGRAWVRQQIREELIHEAGICHELRQLGHRIVPATVYVELADGTPALVRERGVEVTEATWRDVGELERALIDVERDGYLVRDALLVLRRPDGSLFVGDVGLWKAPTEGPRSAQDSDLEHLLQDWCRKMGRSLPPGFLFLPRLRELQAWIQLHSPEQGEGGALQGYARRMTERYRAKVEAAVAVRAELGLVS